MPMDNKGGGAKDKRSKLKEQESQSKVQKSLDGSKAKLGDIEGKFNELTKVLETLNGNIEILKKVEMAQLAGDLYSRKISREVEDDHWTRSGKHMVESNARNEAGLREISKRITLFHGFMAGDSKAKTKERLKIASQEHTDAIKKHRSIGMAQMNFLEKNKIANIAGLGAAGFSKKRAKRLRKEWDELSTHKADKADRSSMRDAIGFKRRGLNPFKDDARRKHMYDDDMGGADKGLFARGFDRLMKDRTGKKYIKQSRGTHTTVMDDGTNAPNFGGSGGALIEGIIPHLNDIDMSINNLNDGVSLVPHLNDIDMSINNMLPHLSHLGPMKANSDKMVWTLIEMKTQLLKPMLSLMKGNTLSDEEKNRELKKALAALARDKAKGGDNVSGSSGSGGGLAAMLAGIAALLAGGSMIPGIGKDSKTKKKLKELKKKQNELKKKQKEFKKQQAQLKKDRANVNKQAQQNKLTKQQLKKANLKLDKRAMNLNQQAKKLNKLKTANKTQAKGILRSMKDWVKDMFRSNPKAKDAVKTVLKGKKALTAIKAALAFTGAGILVAALMMAGEAVAFSFLEEVIREMDAEDKAAMAAAQAKHATNDPYESSLDQTITGTVIETGETLEAVLKSKYAKIMGTGDGKGDDEKPLVIQNSGNTDASIININNYLSTAVPILNTDDLIIGR